METYSHVELLFRWGAVFRGNEDILITFHVKENFQKELELFFFDDQNIVVSGPKKDVNWRKYIKLQRFPNNAVVVLATIGWNLVYLRALFSHLRLFVVVHNANQFANIKRIPNSRISDRFKEVCYRLLFNEVIDKIRGVIVPVESMASIIAKSSTRYPLFVVPFAALCGYKQSSEKKANEPLRIVVPGTVSNKTRDYRLVAQAIKVFWDEGNVCEIWLAGEIRDHGIIELFSKIVTIVEDGNIIIDQNSKVRLHCFKNGLSEREYNDLLSSADILIAPAKRFVENGVFLEEVGVSKVSGVFYDAVFHGKPILVPDFIVEDYPNAHKFSDAEDLANKLLTVLGSKCGRRLRSFNQYNHDEILNSWKNILRFAEKNQL